MSLLDQITNKVAFAVHKATYDPDAESFAKQQADAAKRAEEAKERASKEAKTAEEKAAAEKVAADAKAEQDRLEAERARFDGWRLFRKIINTMLTIVLVFAVFAGGVYGASLAVNLNLYKEAPYRVLYAIYGFLFFFIVIPYVLLYRWWWLGKKPRFYGLIPLIPYHLENRWAALLFSWLSYKPDCHIDELKEWVTAAATTVSEASATAAKSE